MPTKSRKNPKSSSSSKIGTCPVCGLKFNITVSRQKSGKKMKSSQTAVRRSTSHVDHFITINIDDSGKIKKIDFIDQQKLASEPVHIDTGSCDSLVEVLACMKSGASRN